MQAGSILKLNRIFSGIFHIFPIPRSSEKYIALGGCVSDDSGGRGKYIPLGRQYLFRIFQSKNGSETGSVSTSSSPPPLPPPLPPSPPLPPPPPSLLSRPKSTVQFVEPMVSVFSSGFARGAKSAYTYSFFGGVWTPSFAHVQF